MDLDRPVLVIDLRAGSGDGVAPADEVIDEPVEVCAILHDALEKPLLLPLSGAHDRAELDAIARLVRFAVERGERVAKVAIDYGGELERRLAFERRLPRWAYEGIEGAPPVLAATFGKR